jgi:tetratricopeptide (TPR) repeat protein
MSINHMKKYISCIIFIAIGICSGYSQTQKAFIEAAEEAYQTKNYYGALTWFTEALDFDRDDPELIFKVAESARQFEAYDLAAEQYKLLVDSLGEGNYPDASFYLGQMYQRLGKYEDSKNYYGIYISENSGLDKDKTDSATKEMASVEYAITRIKEIDKSADLTEFETEINTPYSEFGALKKDDVLYFSTMKYAEKASENFPPRSISKFHTLKDDLNTVIEGDVNDTDLLVAHSTFTSDGSSMIYTLCEYVNDEDVRCDLYSRMINEDGSFGIKTKLPAPINVDSFTNTQPQISFDSTLQSDVLYFVSDREGGEGKLDVYSSLINSNGSYSEPVNVKEVNTPENDASPFYHNESKTLYFSSDGRLGLGGYDVYSISRTKVGWTEPVNLRVPINSSFHDLYYVLNNTGEEAYFSSNREGTMYLDPAKKACCFDIFKVAYDEIIIELNALVFDELTSDPLNGAKLTLIDNVTGDTVKVEVNEESNNFYFKIKREKEYTLLAEREYYNAQSIPLSTIAITESTIIDKKIYLKTDRTQLKLETFNKRTDEELVGVQIKITNLTTKTIDTIALNELNNKFHFYLELGNKYEIEASKFGFVTETDIVDLTEISEPVLLESKMYLEVFDIEDYMPVTVYFENAYPDPQSKSINTDKIYGNLYSDYMDAKMDYLKSYTKKKKGQEKIDAERTLDAFFEGEVAGGYDKLKRFMRALKKELELGRSLEIAIKGYASPLADTKYNLALGQRRVSSIKNEILNYEGGMFRDYVRQGKLILTDISFGEETSPKDVSDRKSDINSVYSVGASRERRVQIVKITDQ